MVAQSNAGLSLSQQQWLALEIVAAAEGKNVIPSINFAGNIQYDTSGQPVSFDPAGLR